MNIDELISSYEDNVEQAENEYNIADGMLSAYRNNVLEGRTELSAQEQGDIERLEKIRETSRKRRMAYAQKLNRARAIGDEEAEYDRRGNEFHDTKAARNGRTATVHVGSEPSVYRAQDRGAVSPNGDRAPTFLQDLYASQMRGDPAAMGRLERHGREIESNYPEFGPKMRAIGTSAVSGFVPPQYLSELFAEYARAGRPLANLCANAPLPAVGMSFQIPRITTSTAVAVQTAEGLGIGNQDPDDTLLAVPVVTVAGYVDVSRQALERGVLVESMIYGDLSADYNSKLDAQLINGTGSSGQHLGMLGVSGINAITYTDATPTIPEMWPKLADSVGKVVSGRFTGPTAIVLTPTAWAWILAERDTTGRPLVEPESVAQNPIGTSSQPDYTPMALPLGTSQVFETVEFDSAGDVGHTWLVVLAPGEVAGLFRLAGAGPAGAVTDEEPRVEDLQQEGGQGQVKLVRGEKPP